jgi:hypothetical protein
MKKVYSILVTLLSSLSIFSQRVDLDKYNFNASYIELPKMVIDTSYKTYFVEIEASPSLKKDIDGLNLEEYVDIEGWKRLSGIGHVKIFTRLEDVFIESIEVKDREEILKDKNGKETGRKTHYYLQMEYTFAAQAKLSDYKGTQISTYTLANRESRQTYNSKEFSSFIEATLYYKFRGMDFPKLIAERAVRKAMDYLNNDLNYNLGFSPRSVSDFLWILDSKKHPEYNAHRRAWTIFKQAMFQMRAEEPLDQVKQTLVPVISYFEAIKKKYSSDSKGDKKLRYASYFNLAKIYYYLDDPDAVMLEAGELMLNEFDEKDGKRLEAAAVGLKALFKESKFSSRHFPINTEKYDAPEVVSVQ